MTLQFGPIVRSPTFRAVKRFLPKSLRAALVDRATYDDYFSAISGQTSMPATIEPVAAPLLLVSQVERSGGTLLAQLFDGHPQLAAHPAELKIGYPDKETWPRIEGLNPSETFRRLFELDVIPMGRTGYRKGQTRYPFEFCSATQRRIFLENFVHGRPREALDVFFTSYFNAWSNRVWPIAGARYVTGFAPMLAAGWSDDYWSAYPDGHLVSIIRSPLSWFASGHRRKPGKSHFGSPKTAAARWNLSTQTALQEKAKRPGQVSILLFENLLSDTEGTMRRLCVRIGIDFDSCLLRPTFNGHPVSPNSGFSGMSAGAVSASPLARHRDIDAYAAGLLQHRCGRLYTAVLAD